MLICIPDILNADQLSELAGMMDRQSFIDDSETAGSAAVDDDGGPVGWPATGMKEDKRVASNAVDHVAMQTMITEALAANREFTLAAMPLQMRAMVFSRYLPGMGYGFRDDALTGDTPQTQIDLAFTLYLSDPEDYEGGELEIYDAAGTRSFKPAAGAVVLYPADSIHQVTQVTTGRRDVAVGWLQSMVRDPERRRIIYELENLRESIFARSGKTAEFDVLSRNIGDLWRMWIGI